MPESIVRITPPDAGTWTLRNLASGITENTGRFAASPTRALVSLNQGPTYTATIFTSLTTAKARIYRLGADGVITAVIGPATPLPGTTGFLAGSDRFSYDGTTLLMPLFDSTNTGALYRRTNGGTLTRLYGQSTRLPLSTATFNPIGYGDVEGGRIFADSATAFEAVFNADGSLLSAANLPRSVTACGPDSFLNFSGRQVSYRKDNFTVPVVDSAQLVDGFTPTAVVAEAHGHEAAFLATNATSSSVFVSLDTVATAVPVITCQPVSRTMDTGATVSFTALASGDGLTWQWSRNGSPIPGATLNTFTLTGVAAGDFTTYTATATNSLGNAVSNPATLTLNDATSHAPACIQQPADQQFIAGKALSVTYLADPGSSAVSCLWTKNAAPFSSSQGIFFATPAAADAGVCQLAITNATGSAVSRNVTLGLYDPNPVVPPFVVTGAGITGGNFTFTTPVLTTGKTYIMQSSRTLASGTWTTVQTLNGSGTTQPVSIPYNSALPGCFYRIVEAL